MSFDLAVWYEPQPISEAQASATYLALCDADESPAPARPEVAGFHRELTGRFPDLDTAADVDASPWTCRLGITADAVLMTIAWSRADEVKPIVRELAARHGLVCHNPQTGDTDQPLPAGHVPPLTLSSYEDGRTVDPAWSAIEAALRRLTADNWFVILERGEGTFVQAGFGDKAGTAHGWYLVERRDGAPDRHVRTTQSDLAEVIAAFRHFAEDDPQWDRRFTWRPIDA
jgi:hypothetical protein